MRYEQGDLLNAGLQAWGHGVNLDGVMGSGIAKQVKRDYPEVFDPYRLACLSGQLGPGEFLAVEADDGTIVYHLASQIKPGPNAQYGLLASSLMLALTDMAHRGIVEFGLPLIGCGIGGLDWNEVEAMLKRFDRLFPNTELVVYTI